jgi:transposase
MRVMNCRCAGIDVHQKTVVVCILTGEAGSEPQMAKRVFATTTARLLELSDWLREQQITHVAMESTGTYWKPVWAILEGSFDLTLCNAVHIKQVPGRKTDQKDSEWIADLLRHGLLRKSFVPPQPQQDLRELTRYRAQTMADRSTVSNRIRKLLEGANVKLGSVMSDVLGVSGRRMLHALAEGETDVDKLAGLAVGSLVEKYGALRAALNGRVRQHHRLMLRLLLAEWEFLSELVKKIDDSIDQALHPFVEAVKLVRTIPGFSEVSAAVVVAELGDNMDVFPDAAHAASWAGMCPGNNESAGKQFSGRTRSGNRWLKRILCQVAWAAARTHGTYFSAQFRRLSARRGKKRAIVAVGHSLLVTIVTMLRSRRPYQELGPNYFDRAEAESLTRYCVRKLRALGHQVTLSPVA